MDDSREDVLYVTLPLNNPGTHTGVPPHIHAALTTAVKSARRGQAPTATHAVILSEESGAGPDPWSTEAER